MVYAIAEIFAALERKGVIETPCPACGESSGWALASERAALAHLTPSLEETAGPGARVAMVVRPPCGPPSMAIFARGARQVLRCGR